MDTWGEQNTKTENFYYALWLKYYNKIEIYKYLYMNQKQIMKVEYPLRKVSEEYV